MHDPHTDGLKLAEFCAVAGFDYDEFRMLRYRGAIALRSIVDPDACLAALQTRAARGAETALNR